MAQVLFYNNAQSTVAGAITNSSVTVNLASGGGALFSPGPTGGDYFIATFQDAATGLLREIVHVTNVTGDTLTIVRAQESTTAQAWSAGDIFANLVTMGTMANFAQDGDIQSQSTNYAADTGSADALVVTLSPAPGSLSSMIGAPIRIKKGNSANATSAPTLALNGLTAEPIIHPNGSKLLRGELPANGIFEVTFDGTNYELTGAAATAESFASSVIWLTQEETSGTNGGACTVTTFVARNLNTVEADPFNLVGKGIAAVSSGNVTLVAGTYLLEGHAPCSANLHKVRLYNVTDSTVIKDGSSENCVTNFTSGANPDWSHSFVNAVITITGTKVIQLQHWANMPFNTTPAGGDFGRAVSDGSPETYAFLKITVLALS